MGRNFELNGAEAMLTALRTIGGRVAAATPDGLARAAHHLEAMVKLELSRTSHPPGTPTPSPPGSPPSLITGALRRSIQVNGPTEVAPGAWTATVSPDIVYGRIQELGGIAGRGARLPARPYMRPGLIAASPGMHALIKQAWADALS
jgi:phage gpG-like protein